MRGSFGLWGFGIKRPTLPLVKAPTSVVLILIWQPAPGTRRNCSATNYQREKESAKPNVHTTRQVDTDLQNTRYIYHSNTISGVLTKGTIIEVNVSELGLVTAGGKVVWGRWAQITNNCENDGCVNAYVIFRNFLF
jgi:hypothetical protein